MDKSFLYRLKFEFIVMWGLPALLAILYETNVFSSGIWADDKQLGYTLGTLGVLLTFLVIFLALKLFAFKTIKTKFESSDINEAKRALTLWSEVRMSLIGVAMLVNLSIYYVLLNPGAGLCALVLWFASFFCWPSTKPIEKQETEK